MLRQVFRALVGFVSLTSAGLIAGCGMGVTETSVAGPLALNGHVHGGQQGVAGATIQLYRAGTLGNGTASVPLITTTTVTTDKFGFFSVTGDYACANANDQIYLLATGGNPGLNANNPAIAMMAALGNCGDLLTQGANRFVFVNEITTAAAAWALAPFMKGPAGLGRSVTNAAGLQNAVLDAGLLANTTTGAVATSSIGLTIESGKLLALADAIASCINSSGGSNCSSLFSAATPPGGTAPTDTLTAALNIVKNPSNNVAAVFSLVNSTSPFPTTLTGAPNDWTMSLTVPLAQPPATYPYPYAAPTSLDIDKNGTVWVAGYYGLLNAVRPQGALLNASGFGLGALNESFGLTIDTSGYVWVTNEESSPHSAGSVSIFQGSTLSSPGTILAGNGGSNFYDGSIDYPYDVAADATGSVYIANYANGSSTQYSSVSGSTTRPTATFLGYGSASFSLTNAPDGVGGVWLGNNSSDTVTHVDGSGNANTIACCSGPNGLAVDPGGNLWVTNYYGSSFSEVSAVGTTLISRSAVGGIRSPSRLAVDAGGTVWIANYHGSSFSGISSGTVLGEPAAGTALSPSTGFGLDANLLEPYAIKPDASGNLWVSNFANNDLVMFFGMATPTSTPTVPFPAAP